MRPSNFMDDTRRFWASVERSESCWLWTGELNSQGYGRFAFWYEGKRSRTLAHRLSLVIAGTELKPGDVVMHHCDNPLCVNPSHLSVGTQSDNMRDARDKGRLNLSGLALGQTAATASRRRSRA